MPAHLYARVSDRPGVEESESCEFQLERARDYANRAGLALGREFQDKGYSGADSERPALWACVDAVKPGDAVIVYRFDRLARQAFLALTIEDEILKRGGSIISASGEGTIEKSLSPEEGLKIAIIRAFSEYERKVIGLRTKLAMQRHQANGRIMSRFLPLGKMLDPKDKSRMVDNPAELASFEQVRELRQAEPRLTYRQLVQVLEAEQITFRGGKWSLPTLGKILKA